MTNQLDERIVQRPQVMAIGQDDEDKKNDTVYGPGGGR